MKTMKRFILSLLVLFIFCSAAQAQTTEFTYQGRLVDGALPANTNYDFEFRLFANLTDPPTTPPLASLQRLGVAVNNGVFSVRLDFGTQFTGATRYLEIAVKQAGGVSFTTLAPRQPVTSAPYSMHSFTANGAAVADSLSPVCASCVTDAQINTVSGGKVTGQVFSALQADNALFALNVSGIVRIANGGTGSSIQNFVDLSTNQNVDGNKTFIGTLSGNGSGLNNVPGTLKWQTVPGLAQQAQSNNGYLATNDAQVTVTLPTAPNISDVVRVSASGAGGWRIAQNAGQSVIVSNISSISLTGANWTPRESNRVWQSVTSSADGTKLVAVVQNGQIYTSTNSGFTWTPRESNRFWWSVASSADGTKLVAVVNGLSPGGQIYTSTDSGINWTPRDSNRLWVAVASSADGSKLVAAVSNGQLYTSTDSGVNWTPRDSNRQWVSIASSADGSKLIAAVFTGQIYTSSDSGVTWTPRENNRFWRAVTSSADGTKLVAGADNGQLYTSTDSGINWTPRESNRRWWALSSSADGSKLVALVSNGQIYTSSDSGVSWTARESNRFWQFAASSADGGKLVAVVQSGQIYTSIPSTTVGTTGFLTGGQFAAIELQYIGNGQFISLSHSGVLSGF